MTIRVSREQVVRFRARASHLDAKLPSGSFERATHAGLQDTIPRAGVIGLHARLEDVQPDDWEHPSLAQIWFRGGADYIVPRADVGVFTIGASPRDADRRAAIDALADRALDVLDGEVRKVREVAEALDLDHPTAIRLVATSGRLLIRWNASMIWLVGCERPDVDDEDARIELARRFLRWLGPQRKDRFAWWAAVDRRDATRTWDALEAELTTVEIDGEERSILTEDVDALVGAEQVEGVRLVSIDDPLLKVDPAFVIADAELEARIYPRGRSAAAYMGAVLVNAAVAGVWQRQQRRTTVHVWRDVPRDGVEAEAESFPIAGRARAEVVWERLR